MRRRSRECALQILYQLDLNRQSEQAEISAEGLEAAIEAYWDSFEQVQDDEREYTERLARGVVQNIKDIDRELAEASRHWRVSRMDKVDRNLLRLAAFEILRCPDVPRATSINEAIEIAKRFSSSDSAAFINGILDNLGQPSGFKPGGLA